MGLNSVDDLFGRMTARGHGAYGLSAVSQLEHGLQAAALARQDGLDDALVIAALLHDIGHLRTATDEALAERGMDDRHEHVGAAVLARVFGPEVSEPVRLHVIAKRYLVSVEPGYRAQLSPDSVRSLALQRGDLTAAEIAAFEREPFFAQAVALRRLDERAKVPGLAVPSMQDYRAVAAGLVRQ